MWYFFILVWQARLPKFGDLPSIVEIVWTDRGKCSPVCGDILSDVLQSYYLIPTIFALSVEISFPMIGVSFSTLWESCLKRQKWFPVWQSGCRGECKALP